MVPIEIKNSSSVEMLNKKCKWEANDCNCKLCLDYLYRIVNVNLVDD